MTRGYIGVKLRTVDADVQRSLRLSSAGGALVQDVAHGLARRAGRPAAVRRHHRRGWHPRGRRRQSHLQRRTPPARHLGQAHRPARRPHGDAGRETRRAAAAGPPRRRRSHRAVGIAWLAARVGGTGARRRFRRALPRARARPRRGRVACRCREPGARRRHRARRRHPRDRSPPDPLGGRRTTARWPACARATCWPSTSTSRAWTNAGSRPSGSTTPRRRRRPSGQRRPRAGHDAPHPGHRRRRRHPRIAADDSRIRGLPVRRRRQRPGRPGRGAARAPRPGAARHQDAGHGRHGGAAEAPRSRRVAARGDDLGPRHHVHRVRGLAVRRRRFPRKAAQQRTRDRDAAQRAHPIGAAQREPRAAARDGIEVRDRRARARRCARCSRRSSAPRPPTPR